MTNASNDTDPIPVAAVVRRPGEGRHIPQTSVILKAEGRHSGGKLTVYEATLGPRTAGPTPHIHRTADEAFYVLAGEMTFQVGDATHTLPAGSFVFVPHGVAHTFWNAGLEPARQLTFFTPSGIEDVFEARGALRAEGSEPSIEAVTALDSARARLDTIPCRRTDRRSDRSTRPRGSPGLDDISALVNRHRRKSTPRLSRKWRFDMSNC